VDVKKWVGAERANIALVFTDIIGSTKLAVELKNERMNELRNDHFEQGERFVKQFRGQTIKTIGDSMMVAFKAIDMALDFALRFQNNPGHPRVRIRVGIHVGVIDVQGDDLFGANVNLAARVVGENKSEEIWLSQQAKDELEQLGLNRFVHLAWIRHPVTPNGFAPTVFWSLNKDQHPDPHIINIQENAPSDLPPVEYSGVLTGDLSEKAEALLEAAFAHLGKTPGNVSKLQYPEPPADPSDPPFQVEHMWVLTGLSEQDKALIEAVVAHLRKISGDVSLTLVAVKKGSVILILRSSKAGFSQLLHLYKAGQLKLPAGVVLQELELSDPGVLLGFTFGNEDEDQEGDSEANVVPVPLPKISVPVEFNLSMDTLHVRILYP
jgi:class 3 adenylate cyclase